MQICKKGRPSPSIRLYLKLPAITNLVILMSFFYSVKKFRILSPLNAMNRFMLEQHWNLMEIYFENKHNWPEIIRKSRIKFGRRGAPTEPCICQFIL